MYVRSGSVFVWEESEDDAGIKRWTDGCMWSQSRMREPFLFYEEKVQEDRATPTSKSRGHSVGESSSPSLSSLTPMRSSSSHGSHSATCSVPQAYSNAVNSPFGDGHGYGTGLVKQAYSAYVTQPGTSIRKKLHLTAYFTYGDLANLPTLESEPALWNIVIPQGIYRSGKSRTSGRNLANAAEPARPRQLQNGAGGGDSSPSPTSSPSSVGHSPLAQWSGARRGSASYYDGPDGPHLNTYYHQTSYPGNSIYPGSPTSHVGSPRPDHNGSVPRLPPVASLSVDTDAARRSRNSEDSRVINMLNSRGIP
ncbi:hypothetical protein FRC17_003842 [Serendipita sp. 399]|nr:hypothetical protein FRC17_003842 [Serendipita sp. 399]